MKMVYSRMPTKLPFTGKGFHSAQCMALWPEKMDTDRTVRTVRLFHKSLRIKYMYSTALAESALCREAGNEVLYIPMGLDIFP